MTRKLRINLYGGPSIGKSTMAAWLVAHLKMALPNVELVDEFVKNWAYEGKIPKGWDQLLIFASQLHKEEFLFKHGVDTIVTDSPIIQQAVYMEGMFFKPELLSLALKFEKEFPGLHIVLQREPEKRYDAVGRFQTKEQAIDKDAEIGKMVREWAKGPVWESRLSEREALLVELIDYIRKHRNDEV
jgi:adenylate kinase family enzyme